MVHKSPTNQPDSIIIMLLLAEWRELEGKGDTVESLYRDILARPALEATQAAIVADDLAFHLARPATAAESLALVEESHRPTRPASRSARHPRRGVPG